MEPYLVANFDRNRGHACTLEKVKSRTSSTTFTYLCREIKNCKICQPQLPLLPNPVFRASPDARILIASQAPGIRVHQSGIPFDDPSGNRLREWLGVDRNTFYDSTLFAIIPMGFCYPGTGTTGDRPPRKECATTWRKPLLRQLPKIETTLAIGQYAIQWHLGIKRKSTLTETVRHWRDFFPEMIPLPHPSPRNNIWLSKNPWFEKDVLPWIKWHIQQHIG
ncbi:MAG: uracil-DNA glycosylase family protein [Gammaproteobacteria bacterium]|nr:uracil-DNA glycosylase family protein [Gammaproteobacteria bacterium]